MIRNIWLLITCFLYLSHTQAAQELDGRYIFDTETEVIEHYYHDAKDKVLPRANFPQKYRIIDAVTKTIYERMKSVTGNSNISMPIVVLSKQDGEDHSKAYVCQQTNLSMSSNVISISQSRLDDPEALYGILAHEMAHYFKNHGAKVGNKAEIIKGYNADEMDCIECLTQPSDHSMLTQAAIDLYEAWQGLSHFHFPELNNLPIDPYDGDKGETASLLQKLMFSLEEKGIVYQDDYCKDAYNSYADILNLHILKLDRLHQKVVLSEEEKSSLSLQSMEVIINGRVCLKGKEQMFDELLQEQWGINSTQARALLHRKKNINPTLSEVEISFVKILASDSNPMDKLLEVSKLSLQEIEQLVKQVGHVENLRYLSDEDEADELALKTLVGTSHQKGLFKFILSNGTREQVQECKAIIESGQEPHFGAFLDKHHSYCWRYWRLSKLLSSIN